MTSRRRLVVSVAVVAILLLLGRAIAAAALDYDWYDALGAGAVWRARALSILVTATVTASLGTLFAFANLLAVRGSVVSLVLPRRVANLEIGEEVPPRYLLAASLFASLLLGAALTEIQWRPVARFVYGDAFGENDPYFGRDLGFFAHVGGHRGSRPAEREARVGGLLEGLLPSRCEHQVRAPTGEQLEALRSAGLASVLRVPVVIDGETVGHFECDNRNPRTPSFELHAAAELFAQIFGMIL